MTSPMNWDCGGLLGSIELNGGLPSHELFVCTMFCRQNVAHGAVLSQPGHRPVGCNDAQDGHTAEMKNDRQEVKGGLSAADCPRKTKSAADHAVKAKR